jgi:hypothetical protein
MAAFGVTVRKRRKDTARMRTGCIDFIEKSLRLDCGKKIPE